MADSDGTRDEADLRGLLGDVPLEITVLLGRKVMTINELAASLKIGSIIQLSELTGTHLEIRINGRMVAHGEAVAVGEHYGIRITSIEEPQKPPPDEAPH